MRQNDGVSFALKFAYFIGSHTPNVIRGALSVTMTMVWSIVKMVIPPVGLGLLVRLDAPRLVAAVVPVLSWVSVIAIAIIVAIVVAGSRDKLA